jgi:hypothetical protein
MNFQFNGVNYFLTVMQLLVTAVIIVLVVGIAIAAYVERRRTKTLAFRNRFGSEYEREIQKQGSRRHAESKLADRQERVGALEIRVLGVTEQERFVTEWHTVQSRFVDHPRMAVTEADDLINALLEAKGYPESSFEQRANDLSVNYPRIMDSYRAAHAVAVRLGHVEATTEELRTAMIKYRNVFDELVLARMDRHQATAA